MQSENIAVENIYKIGFQQPLNPEHGIVKLPPSLSKNHTNHNLTKKKALVGKIGS